jgi:hypothetical protein
MNFLINNYPIFLLMIIFINLVIVYRSSIKETYQKLIYFGRLQRFSQSSGFGLSVENERSETRFNILAGSFIIVFALSSLHFFGQTPLHYRFDLITFQPKTGFEALYALKKEIPESASLSVPSDVGTLLCERMNVYLFPNINNADYIVFDIYHRNGDDYWDLNQIINVLNSGKYGIYKIIGRFGILKKGHPTLGVDKLIQDLSSRAKY